MSDKVTYAMAGIQSIKDMLANPTNQHPSSAQNPVPSQDGDMTQRHSNSTSQHPIHTQHPARGHGEWMLEDDVSQGHDTDNWSYPVHLDLSVDYITVFNE